MKIYTEWMKTGRVHDFVFLGKEIIATASGNYVIFSNLVTKQETIEYFNSLERGKGACCLAGHPIVPIFSTAERCFKPKIYIHTYPGIKRVAVCKHDKSPNTYISCCFAGTEYLLSLSSFPNFQLTVWFWRTGQNMYCIDTMVECQFQTIQASSSLPHLLYQFSTSMGKLLTYEIYSYSKNVMIINNPFKTLDNQIADVCWSSNGNLLVCDIFGNVYVFSSDGKKMQIILPGISNVETKNLILSFCNGFVILDTNLQLTYYSRAISDTDLSDHWIFMWSVNCSFNPVKITRTLDKEGILLCSDSGKIFELHMLESNEPEIKEIFNCCQKFQYMCLVEPLETHIVVLDKFNCLKCLNVVTGYIESTYQLDQDDKVLCMVSHPNIPLLGVSNLSGMCIFFTTSKEKFHIFETIYLQHHPQHKIKFSKNGLILGAMSLDSNNFFLLQTALNKKVEVISCIEMMNSIVDFLIFECQDVYKLLILIKTSCIAVTGHYIEMYSINMSNNKFRLDQLIDMQTHYQELVYGFENVCQFLALPYLSKQLHLFNIEDDYKSVSLIKTVFSEHKLRKFIVNISKTYTISSGIDGCINIRETLNLTKILNNFVVHHYQEKGTRYTVLSQCCNVMVSLGQNGSLIALKFYKKDAEKEETLNANVNVIENILWKNSCTSEILFDKNKTWFEKLKLKIIEQETNECLHLRTNISEKLKKLKLKIKLLLDMNESKTEKFQLEMSAFDLNVNERKEKINNALRKQEATKKYLQEHIIRVEKVINYLMQEFWNSLEVHDHTIVCFNSEIYVDNYSLNRIDKLHTMDDFSIDLFKTPSYLNKFFKLKSKENKSILELCYKKKDFVNPDSEYAKNFSETSRKHIAITGTTSFKWIKEDTPFSQFLTVTTIFDNNDYDIIDSKERKLKIIFNKKFDEMKKIKFNILKQTNNRLKILKKCKSELKSIFGIVLEDNEFTNVRSDVFETTENVEIITNGDIPPEFKISANLYNDEEEFEDTQNEKKLLLNVNEDNLRFRKEKLNEMMDGLLEIRWENEVRKEVPKPDCVIFKNPSKYDMGDIVSIEIYQEKVKKLEAEKHKYKIHLELEILNISNKIKTNVEDFNNKMEEFALEKIKIESAILQEFALRLNNRMKTQLKECIDKRIFYIINHELVLLENKSKSLIKDIFVIEPIVVELKSRYEGLNKRDKLLEGKFRGEFEDLKQPMIEHLLRQYKRRPRISQIICTSLTFLVETGKCLMSGIKSAILPKEYLDYLRGMDALDLMPSSLPPQIDSNHWQLLCKLRRSKAEIEIKLRIAVLELADAEQTLLYLQKSYASIQNKICSMKNILNEERQKQSNYFKDPYVQLVIKSSQIEALVTGYSTNCSEVFLIPFKQLVQVNNKIFIEGGKKINSIRSIINLRQSINIKDWKYRCLIMKIKHSKKHLAILQNTKIIKGMQYYLIERLEGNMQYKDITVCDSKIMLKSVQKKFKGMLLESKRNLLEVILEIQHWRRINHELSNKVELCLKIKNEQSTELEEDRLLNRNKIFHKNHFGSIMERTKLVARVEKSRNELIKLQTELELLRLKTFPTLRFKDSYYCKRKSYLNIIKSLI